MKQITKEHGDQILAELCRRVGEDAKTFDFTQPNWYWKHLWTQDEEEDFRKWLGKKLEEWHYCRGKYRDQSSGYYQAGKIIMYFGWRTDP